MRAKDKINFRLPDDFREFTKFDWIIFIVWIIADALFVTLLYLIEWI